MLIAEDGGKEFACWTADPPDRARRAEGACRRIAAIGLALAVYGEADDAPGGVLLGMLLIVGAFVLGVRTVQRRR